MKATRSLLLHKLILPNKKALAIYKQVLSFLLFCKAIFRTDTLQFFKHGIGQGQQEENSRKCVNTIHRETGYVIRQQDFFGDLLAALDDRRRRIQNAAVYYNCRKYAKNAE